MHLINEKAPKAVKNIHLDTLTGKNVACDASMSIYQFLIATQTMKQGFGVTELKDSDGNLTGHLLGLLNRSIMMMENGIKPAWVFDGKPPEMKGGELLKRKEAKEKATEEYKQAVEDGDMVKQKQMAQRTIRVSPEMTADAKKLVTLMGLPCIEASGEAEAQCSILAKAGKVYGTMTEDMDALTFGTPVLLRGLNAKKEPIVEIHLDLLLEGFGMNMEEFTDLCILCGCDYTSTIAGVGPIKAFNYMKDCGSIEKVIEQIEKDNANPKRKKKFIVPEDFDYVRSREMFFKPDVQDSEEVEMKWKTPDEEGLKNFLVTEKGFQEANVVNAINKLKKSKTKSNQGRLDSFFKKK